MAGITEGKEKSRAQKPEVELIELEAQIEKYRQRLRLLKSEGLAEMEEKSAVIEKQQTRIKELKATIEGLQTALKRGHAGDEKVLKKAFQKYYHDIGITRNKSAKEVAEILENRVFDLNKNRDLIKYDLKKKERLLEETRNQCDEMEQMCKVGTENQGTIERAKQLENNYQKAHMRITEMEYIQRIYKDILDRLSEDLTDLPERIEKLDAEFKDQQTDIESLLKREAKSREARDHARAMLTETESQALHARQEKDKVMTEFNQILEHKQLQMAGAKLNKDVPFEPYAVEAERLLTDMKVEQEKSLANYKEAFEQIKTVTGVADISEAEQRFTTQKAVRRNLLELKKQCEKKYGDIKLEKQYLETQMETMMGANLACPKTTLEETLEKYKREQDEQARRKEAATSEYERITKTLAEVKTSLWQLSQLIQRHLGQDDNVPSEIPEQLSLSELADLIFIKYEDVLNLLKGRDTESLMKRMKDEQHFFKKQGERPTDLELRGKGKPHAEEESSSEDEELKKRATLKKDAQNFADIKQKQKGRGHAFKL